MSKQFIQQISILLLVCIFFVSGIGKIFNFNETVTGMRSKYILNIFPLWILKLVLVCVIILEIAAPLIILKASSDIRYHFYAILSIIGLIIFTIAATALYHFPPTQIQYYFFMKNVSIIGGLCSVLSFYLK